LVKPAVVWIMTACLLAPAPALAADPWPIRPVTVICPFPPGISTDIVTRAVATALSEALGQQFVMENRPGANGNIGAGAAAKAAPDGYTFLVATLGPTVANKFMYKTMSYDPERAFAPVVLLGSSPLIIVGSPKIPPVNLRELIAYAKNNPGKLNAGTVGHGSQAHITLELINKLAGTSIVHVPYRIATQALPDLISGDLQVGFNYIPTFVPAVQQGTIRGLAVTSLKRVSDLPDVPTADESGFPGFEASGWNALFAPAGTPQPIIARLAEVMAQMAKDPEIQKRMSDFGSIAVANTPAEFTQMLREETDQWAKALSAIGLKR
jgi:tripartite-type tricarboxylate transporter receptor subunit TctC